MSSMKSMRTTNSKGGRKDPVLIFDPDMQVPDAVKRALVDEWIVPALVESYFRETRRSTSSTSPREVKDAIQQGKRTS